MQQRTNLDPVTTLKAIGNGTRVLILQKLLEGPLFVNEIVHALQANQPTISEHLKVLHSAGILCKSKIARKVKYQIMDTQMQQLISAVMKLLRSLAYRHHQFKMGYHPKRRPTTKSTKCSPFPVANL